MLLPTGATVAVADGKTLSLFRNTGKEGAPKLHLLSPGAVDGDHSGADVGHRSSFANPDDRTVQEDGFAVGVADLLNREVLDGNIAELVVIAPPRTLGELRKHYHRRLSAVLMGEIGKELAGRSVADIEQTIVAA
ncbi:MAG TPA: host attachment protein [Caulobacteraceae bacterium]|jgi:protein required for attachment to host cells|nr:host attachment protein [Caulobacteraceae bacterium]